MYDNKEHKSKENEPFETNTNFIAGVVALLHDLYQSHQPLRLLFLISYFTILYSFGNRARRASVLYDPVLSNRFIGNTDIRSTRNQVFRYLKDML